MKHVLGALLLGLLAACSSSGVAVDYDSGFDFAGLSTYAWTEGVPAENELNERRIVQAVDGQLAAHGFRRVEEGPELLVRTEVSSRQEVRSSGGSVGVGYGGSRGAVGLSSGNRVYEVTVGTLVIELVDAASQGVVWRAEAQKTVGNDPQDTAKKIEQVTEKAFESFPPQP
jgi:hypothetical protein